jgi:hypothetical protein
MLPTILLIIPPVIILTPIRPKFPGSSGRFVLPASLPQIHRSLSENAASLTQKASAESVLGNSWRRASTKYQFLSADRVVKSHLDRSIALLHP